MPSRKLHIITNSHIDPIWIWNRSSGRCSWNNTIATVVRMMKLYPELKFSCSASTLYRWIEETDPRLFRDISALVGEKRWEVVGGWEVQSDAIISRTEPLLRQAQHGKRYFQDRFGVDVKTAYNVDAFGHSAGLPKILRASGFEHYVYMRGQETPGLFRWKADDGSSVTALHIESYGIGAHLDQKGFVDRIRRHWETGLPEQVVFMGVGDHGGGIFQRHMEWLREASGEFPLVFSTLEEYFAAVSNTDIPELSGEMGPAFRGCYSACHQVKHKIARALEKMLKAETLGVDAAELDAAWKELLFNHFHDILPGTSVREAFERDIFPGLGLVEHTANALIDRELCRRNAAVDTSFMPEGGIQVWNPHLFPAKGIVSFDGFTDPNNTGGEFSVLQDRDGKKIPLQLLPPATSYGPFGDAWGRMTAVVELPASSECYLAYGKTGKAFPNVGFEKQRQLLQQLSFAVFYDNSCTWGFNLEAFKQVIATLEPVSVTEYADGPVCSILRAEYHYQDSEIILDLVSYRDIEETQLRLRLDWHEINCCLKLVLAHQLADAVFMTGASASLTERMACKPASSRQWIDGKRVFLQPASSERPFIDWCAVSSDNRQAGFYAADLHSCDHAEGALRLTLLRPTLHADHAPFTPATEDGWMEQGLTWLDFWHFDLATDRAEIPHHASARLFNAETHEVTTHEAGDPYPEKMPVVKLSSRRVTATINRSEAHACNYGNETETVTIGNREFPLPAKALRIIPLPE